MTCSQSEKADIQQLQDVIQALTLAFIDFKHSQELHHESYLNTFQALQTQP